MKSVKNEKILRKDYGPVVVWLDDLSAILDIFREAAGELSISDDNYKFDTLDEAKNHFATEPTHALKIASYKPSASVEFDKTSVTVFVHPSLTSRQLFHELDDILARCERKPRILFTMWMILIQSIPWAITAIWEPVYAGVPIFLALQVVLIGLLLWGQYIAAVRHSVIIFQRRYDRKTFFTRNRDSILLAIITSIISGTIGYGFAKVKDGWTPLSLITSSETKTPSAK